MNWMTSAKKRVSKASKYKSDTYKRANAYKKLQKAGKQSFLRAANKDTGFQRTPRIVEDRADGMGFNAGYYSNLRLKLPL